MKEDLERTNHLEIWACEHRNLQFCSNRIKTIFFFYLENCSLCKNNTDGLNPGLNPTLLAQAFPGPTCHFVWPEGHLPSLCTRSLLRNSQGQPTTWAVDNSPCIFPWGAPFGVVGVEGSSVGATNGIGKLPRPWVEPLGGQITWQQRALKAFMQNRNG